MHQKIEEFLNNNTISTIDSKELSQFHRFFNDYIVRQRITPYRTEWRIADPEFSLAGSVDFVGKFKNGKYVLMDWKRSKNLIHNLKNDYHKHGR